MKKVILSFYLLLITIYLVKAQCNVQKNDIYTPMGSPVVTMIMCDYSEPERMNIDAIYAINYPNAAR
ncbi:MAG: hypothetical protein LBD21_05485 [Tannerellaceae bacterium]|jgi:hypothetical protein|nr:hypothetical protein [Tannerellaceae bacterium]